MFPEFSIVIFVNLKQFGNGLIEYTRYQIFFYVQSLGLKFEVVAVMAMKVAVFMPLQISTNLSHNFISSLLRPVVL
jgi:hypothetical protein